MPTHSHYRVVSEGFNDQAMCYHVDGDISPLSWFHIFYSHKPVTSRVLCVNMVIVSQANIGG